MPQIQPPEIEPMGKAQISDFERFALAYFNIRLTSWQLQYINAMVHDKRIAGAMRAGRTTAKKVLQAYIDEGLKPDGRARLPQINLPAHAGRTKLKNKTQHGRVLEMIKRPGGAFNFELSRISLRYGGTIFELRKDGHNIVTERQYLKNGRASNTFLYRMAGD
jgi:hypothetical protein